MYDNHAMNMFDLKREQFYKKSFTSLILPFSQSRMKSGVLDRNSILSFDGDNQSIVKNYTIYSSQARKKHRKYLKLNKEQASNQDENKKAKK